MSEFDVLIKDATIVQGTGKKPYHGNVGVKGDRVVATGDDVKGDAKQTIDAGGLLALPGFIDAHSHADLSLLNFTECKTYLMQGVTTFIGGQCGQSMGPLGEYVRVPRLLGYDWQAELEPYKYYPGLPFYPRETVNEWMREKYDWALDWETMGGFFKKVEEVGISMNYAPLVGHCTIRTKVMGLDYKRHSTQAERDEMHELIHQAMQEGCLGMTAGLDYDPDVFASHEEMVEAVGNLKEYNGVYQPHWRRTGRRRGVAAGHVANEKITALMECVDAHNRTGTRLCFAHLGTGWDIHPSPPAELQAANLKVTLDMILKDVKGELDITWNAIPFMVRGGFAIMPYLCSLLEPWLRELGSREALGKWLKVKEFRDEVKEAIRDGTWFVRVAYNPNTNPHWARNITVTKHRNSELDGKTIAQIAEARGADQFDTYFDVIAEDPNARGITGGKSTSKVSYPLYTHPRGMVGLDTLVYDENYMRRLPPYTMPGINTFSAYPLFYQKFVREEQVFTLDEAVQKTATMPARVHNMTDRGVLREGSYADIVVMDLENLKVNSTELESRQYPEGIMHVLVNGVQVVDNGRYTGAKPGRVIKRE